MKAIVLTAKWEARPGFKLGAKDIEGQLTWLGSKVWRYPEVNVVEKDIPQVKNKEEVLIEVRACGICGSDVHMAQPDEQGYILYPGLTAFPCTLGHEFSGVVVEAGKLAIDKRTGKRFEVGEPLCSEEMLWCGVCRPCADGNPNATAIQSSSTRLHLLSFEFLPPKGYRATSTNMDLGIITEKMISLCF